MKDLELLGFPQLADRVVRPALHCFVRMVWPIALPMVAIGILMVGLQSRWMSTIQSGRLDFEFGAGLVGILAAALFVMIWSTLCLWAASISAVDLLAGRPASFWRGLRRVFEGRILLTLVLSLLVNLGGLMVCGVGIFATMALLFPLIPLMIEENVYGTAAIRRSIDLVKSNATGQWADSGFFQSLGLLFIGWGIMTAIGWVVQMPFMLYQQYYIWNETLSGRQIDLVQMTEELNWIQIPVQVVNIFAQMLGWFYWAVGGVVLYHEIRRRREGGDLAAAIPRILGRHDGG